MLRVMTIAVFSFIYMHSVVAAGVVWPVQNEVDIKPLQAVFEQVFVSDPADLSAYRKGLQACKLPAAQARKLTGLGEEYVTESEGVFTSIVIDVEDVDVLSSAKGCAALGAMQIEKNVVNEVVTYQIPVDFTERLALIYEYTYKSKTKREGISASTMKYSAKVESVRRLQSNTAYMFETLTISNTSTEYGPITSSSIMFEKKDRSTVTLSGGTYPMLVISQIRADEVYVSNFMGGEYPTVMHFKNGHTHGIQEHSIPQMNGDKKTEQSCYVDGKKINVFKRLNDTECQQVPDVLAGTPGVVVDFAYQLELRQKAAEQGDQSLHERQSAWLNKPAEPEPVEDIKLTRFKQLRSQASCRVMNDRWVHVSGGCVKTLADGEGISESDDGLKFIGKFSAGVRSKGEIHQNGEMIFSGDFIDDKPSGAALCLYEGEYEECRFYKGKRIDALYKIRQENERNQQKMAEIKNQSEQHAADNSTDKNYLADAVKQEASKRAAKFIFDSLF